MKKYSNEVREMIKTIQELVCEVSDGGDLQVLEMAMVDFRETVGKTDFEISSDESENEMQEAHAMDRALARGEIELVRS